ncbi:hypothetical protein [Vibrio ulleungensis]|uniref:Dual-action HEIGH metallo-peptidase n=1 Tax=Vibrio ulleungensis TaxID=2807619 RepID=A0ABS2HHT2_9VIBR|nr:hypothetical protein [Vibrio ulleungensis]MBM7035397.1 hypothetical protein [Vibrio ulleungensis]
MNAKSVVICGLSLNLLGCFGITGETDGLVDQNTLAAYLESSNRSINHFPYLHGLDQRGTVRFDTTSSIPLYYVTDVGQSVPKSILESVEVMRNQLGVSFSEIQVLNEDIEQYRNFWHAEENIGNGEYSEDDFKLTHGITGGIVFSIDSAFYSHQYTTNPNTMCANAGQGPYDGGLSINVDTNTHTFEPSTLLWVNLGNRQCSWDKGIVLHEMAHALGLFHHFDYFGKWNTTSMAVLKMLYRNPAGTPFYALQ